MGLAASFLAAILVLTTAAAQEERQHKGQPASYWIVKLQSGTLSEKRDAAVAMALIAPQRHDAVDLLIAALDQRTDYQLQVNAANALMRIGPFAEKAIPALIRALGAPDIEDNSIREQAASALSVVATEAPAELASQLEGATREAVIHGLLRALGYLRAGDARTLSAVLNILEARPDTADGIYDRAVWLLDRIGESAVPAIVERLRETKSSVAAAALVESLGKIYLNMDGRQAPAHVMEALLVASRSPDERVMWRSIRALENGYGRSPAAAIRIKELLRDEGTEASVVGVAARAGAVLFPQDSEVVDLLANRLRVRDHRYTSDVIDALRKYGSSSVPVLLALMRSTPTSEVVYGTAKVLSDRRFARDDVVSALAGVLGHADQEVVIVSLEALAELAPASLSAVQKIASLTSSGDQGVRAKSVETAGHLAQYMLGNDTAAVEIRGLKESFELALRSAGAAKPEYSSGWEDEVVRPLSLIVDQLKRREWFRLTVIAVGVLAVLLVVFALLALSWRVRRWLRVLSGRRWILHVGECEFYGRVIASAEGLRISLRPKSEGQSAVLERVLAKPRLTPDPGVLNAFRGMLQPQSRVRIEVEEPYFGQPWAKLLVGPWDNPNGCIGGQIALSEQVPRATKHYGRFLEFRALASGRGDSVYGPLPMASAEVEAIGAHFKKWGAHVFVRGNDATSADLAAALREADVVHVSAHANFDRILLADRPFTIEDLSSLDLATCRCRLLVLSACEAGDLNQRHALLWTFVGAGINVIGATRPVHDLVCKVLFEEFYAALLPTRQTEGIDLANAVRTAVGAARSRLFAAFGTRDQSRVRHAFDQTVSSFVIFGDPSLSLKLARPV